MNAILDRLPGPAIDPKRIAANSAVICLHMAVLMALMLPPRFDAPASTPDNDMVVVPIEKRITPPPRPKPLEPTRPLLVPFKPSEAPRTITPEEITPVADDPGPMDVFQPEVTIEPATDFGQPGTGRVFARLSTDRAPAPPFPPQALKRRLTGTVTLRILVDETGQPLEVSVENSSGHRLLDEAARKFVKARWHFVPARQGGVAVQALALVPIDFVIEG